MEVQVYAAADEVELILDGRSLGRAPAGEKHRFRATFEVPYEPGVLEAVAWVGDEVVGRTALSAASEQLVLDVRVDRPEITANPSDLAFVELALVDETGTVHTVADRRIDVVVDGPGVLQALGSGNPVSDEPFTGTGCTTFDGRALAVIRPTAAGTITVTATAEGCGDRSVQVDAR